MLNGAARSRDARVHGVARSTSSARRRPTTTTPSAGRTRWTRRTSGRSRSPRTGAARATARSSTGRTDSTARGEVRAQFHHVIDVAPTVLEAAGLPEPTVVDGVEQRPIEGVSMRYSFDDAGAAERRTTQYFEMFCNRGIYHEGWTAVTRHSTPWVMAPELPALDDDVWELYDPEHRLEPGPRPRRGAAGEARRAPGALFSRRRGSTTSCRSTTGGWSASTPISPGRPTLITGQLAAPVRRHGALDGERAPQREEQVARGDGGGRRPGGRRERA